MCQRGFSHRVIAPGPVDRLEIRPSCPSSELELIQGPTVPYDPTYHLLWRPDRVVRSVRQFRPDVLEVHSAYVAALGALSAPRSSSGIRTMVWHSDHLGTYLEPWLEPRLGERPTQTLLAPLWGGVRALTACFDATFVASRSQQRALQAHGAERIVLLPFGVDRSTFVPPVDGGGRPLRVVACGRMALEKRWDVIFRAFAEAARERPEWTLLAVGDGPERPALERLAAELLPPGRIELTGFVKGRAELATTLGSADIFLHGCPHETFGLSVAEALACGLCAVVPVEGGAGEWVDGARVRGFSGSDPSRAAHALTQLMELSRDARRTLPIPAVPSVEDHFDQLLAHYDELLARASRAKAGA